MGVAGLRSVGVDAGIIIRRIGVRHGILGFDDALDLVIRFCPCAVPRGPRVRGMRVRTGTERQRAGT